MERLIRVEHLKQYVRKAEGQREAAQDLAMQVPSTFATPRAISTYIHRGPIDEKYNSKRKRQVATRDLHERIYQLHPT